MIQKAKKNYKFTARFNENEYYKGISKKVPLKSNYDVFKFLGIPKKMKTFIYHNNKPLSRDEI